MECRLQHLCKFCECEDPALFLRPVPAVDLPPSPAARRPEPAVKRHYTRKAPVGGGSIVERPGKKVYLCKKCDFTCENRWTLSAHYRNEHTHISARKLRKKHLGKGNGKSCCKKCGFTADDQGAMMRHYRKEHPKTKAAGRTFKDRGGKNTKAMGLDKGNLEESTTGLKVNKDSDVRHAFDILQIRSNDCTLSRTEQKDFDKLEDETADFPLVETWTADVRRNVIKLYNEVVNGVLEEK